MRRSAPIVLVALLAVAGCGSSSKSAVTTAATGPSVDSFKTAFAAQKLTLTQLGKDVGVAVEGANKVADVALVKQFESLSSRATALAGSMAQLEAPAPFRAELSSLESSLTQVAGTLRQIEAAAAAHDAAAARAGGEAIVTDAQQVKAVDIALSKKLGLPAEP
jgi:hypothetical protein